MKKEISILVAGLIFFSSIGIVVPLLSGSPVEHQIEPFVDECDCQNGNTIFCDSHGNIYTVMSSPMDCTTLPIAQPTLVPTELPEQFSWKDVDGVDYTTDAKNQGNCGSCWDFGALGALESRIMITEDCPALQPDLSEQYVLSCLPAAANTYGRGCEGGTPYAAYYYIMNTSAAGNYVNGIIPETCFPYEASHEIPCDEKCEDWMDQLIPLSNCSLTFLDLGYATEENTNIIKTILYEEGPFVVALNVTEEFVNYWGIHHSPDVYYPDTHEPWGNMLNHMVMLVGWKDDASIDNGGYWIVKNSWGTDWGYDGFFNLEYYSLFFGMYYATGTYDPESVDWAPIADAGGLYRTEAGEMIIFDATASIDPESPIESYAWDFGDNTSGSGPTASHTYSTAGVYGVTLTVTDSEGNSGTDTTLVGVGQDPVTLDAQGNLGIDVTVESHSTQVLDNVDWSADFSGLLYARHTNGKIPLLSEQYSFSTHIPIVGFGVGTVTIAVEGLTHTERFFILGPLVFGLRLQ